MNPGVSAVKPINNYKLKISFENGQTGIYDCSGLLNLGVFKELKNVFYFKRAKAIGGAVAWPNEQDICSDTLYLDSQKT